jgi:hypothetical protein
MMTDLGPYRHVREGIEKRVAEIVIDRPDMPEAPNVDAMLDFDQASRALEFRPASGSPSLPATTSSPVRPTY